MLDLDCAQPAVRLPGQRTPLICRCMADMTNKQLLCNPVESEAVRVQR